MGDPHEWLLKRTKKGAGRVTEGIGDAARSLPDPNDTSERAEEDAADRHAAETEEYGSGATEHARAEAARRATGSNKQFLRHSSDTQGFFKDVEDRYTKLSHVTDRAARVVRSPHWYQLPSKVVTYVTGVAVSAGVAIGVVKAVEKQTPSPIVIIDDAVQRVQDQVRLEQLRQGIERNGQLMAAMYDPAQGVPERVPPPREEPIPIPVEIVRMPIRVDRAVAPGESVVQPQPIGFVITPQAIIPQLTTPQAQTAAVKYIQRAQAQGQQVAVTFRQWRTAPSSNPPTSINHTNPLGGFYVTLNTYGMTP